MSQTTTMPNTTQNRVTLALMIVVAALALFSLYMGFQSYIDEDMTAAVLYLVIGSCGFIAIGYSMFRAKPVTKDKLEVKEAEVITTLECNQCNLKRVRAFERGDYIFKQDEPCTRCEGFMRVTRIHTKEEEKKKKATL